MNEPPIYPTLSVPRAEAPPPPHSHHNHTLRPRRSFQRASFSLFSSSSSSSSQQQQAEKGLRSPLKLALGKANQSTDSIHSTGNNASGSGTVGVGTSAASGSGSGNGNGKVGNGLLSVDNSTVRGGRAGGGAMLFPPSPEANPTVEVQPPPPTTTSTRRPPTSSSNGIKKLATAVSGAFSSPSTSTSSSSSSNSNSNKGTKIRASTRGDASASSSTAKSTSKSTKASSTTKTGFDLSDWNHDLADIASHPSSSSAAGSSSPPRPTPPSSSRSSLAAPLSSDSRRRKSDEMDDEDRPSFEVAQAAVPVRREGMGFMTRSSSGILGPSAVQERYSMIGGGGGGGHLRSQSLAHAHTLRSSRTLLSSFAFSSPGGSATTAIREGGPQPFGSPFSASNSSSIHPLSNSSSSSSSAPPPTKRISIEGLGGIISEEEEDEDDEDSSFDHSSSFSRRSRDHSRDRIVGDENVFGGPSPGVPLGGVGGGKKVPRARSLTRPNLGGTPSTSHPSSVFGGGSIIPPSQSHPGWSGPGFALDLPSSSSNNPNSPSIAFVSPFRSLRHLNQPDFGLPSSPNPNTSSSLTATSSSTTLPPPSSGRRSRAASTASNLDTLAELGPAVEHFAKPTGGLSTSTSSSNPSGLGGVERMEDVAMTPPRRRGSTTPSSVAGGGEFGLFNANVVGGPSTSIVGGGPGRGRPKIAGEVRSSFASTSSTVAARRRSQLSSSTAPSVVIASPFGGKGISPPRWSVRSTSTEEEGDLEVSENEDEDMEDLEEVEDGWSEEKDWSMSVPALTDGTTSASSSLSTSLSSHADPGGGTGGGGDGELFKVKSYSDVKPLAAAFVSAGLVSKRHSLGGAGVGASNTKPRDSGISMGLASPFNQAATGSGKMSLGGGGEGENEMDLDEGNSVDSLQHHHQLSTSNSGLSNSTSGNSLLSLPPTNPKLSSLPVMKPFSPIMPDTPIKKSAFSLPPPPLPSTSSITSLPIHAHSNDPPLSATTSSNNLTSSTLLTRRSSASPLSISIRPSDPSSSPSSGTDSPTTLKQFIGVGGPSPSPKITTSDLSPTQLPSRSSSSSTATTSISSSQKLKARTALFRRRSSGHLGGASSSFITEANSGSYLGVVAAQQALAAQRSGSSSASGSSGAGEGEPMTPTRSVGHNWSDATQLISTPHESPLMTPATPAFPPSYMLSNLVPPPLATPRGRTSFPFSEVERRQHVAEGPHSLSGRPQTKLRHSGSVLLPQRQQESWFETNYSLLRALGYGAFSDAFEVFDRKRSAVYAVKRTKHPFSGNKDRLRRLEEVDILRLLTTEADPSPHIISLIDAWEHSGHLFIQTELCAGGNLAVFLDEYGREHEVLDEARVWKILSELSAGVSHLHEKNVIHLDLKPANVFITEKGNLKLGDFGLATRWPRTDALTIFRGAAVPSPGGWDDGEYIWRPEGGERRVRAKSNGDAPEDLEREGDREYIAPEILGGRYGKEADVFSLGLIIVEAAANVVLPDNGLAWHKLRSNDLSDVDLSSLSEHLVQLIPKLLVKSPDNRFTIREVSQHPVVGKLRSMLSGGEVKGAVVAENECFVHDLLLSVYRNEGASTSGDMEVDA